MLQFHLQFIILMSIKAVTSKYMDMTYRLNGNIPVYPNVRRFQLRLLSNVSTPYYWFQLEELCSTAHIGTHMDAPCHFAKGAWCIDDIPFERFILPAIVVDFTEKAKGNPNATVSVDDLINWEKINGKIPDGSIVVARSGWGKFWPDKEKYMGTTVNDPAKLRSPGFSLEAAYWLVKNRHIYAVGVDSLLVDSSSDTRYPVHSILYQHNIYGLENLANVDKLPVKGATLFAMPINIENGSGAPSRVFAELPNYV